MSGYDNYNFDDFGYAADRMRDHGFVVMNPAETAGGVTHLPRSWYFRFDFDVIANVDAVVVLPGWRRSLGAKAEMIYASEIGVPIYEYNRTTGRPGRRIEVDSWDITTI